MDYTYTSKRLKSFSACHYCIYYHASDQSCSFDKQPENYETCQLHTPDLVRVTDDLEKYWKVVNK